MRPNAIDDRVKAAWAYELEGSLCETFMIDEAPKNTYQDQYAELLMPYPRDEIYPLYLCAMIDNAQEETALYANDMVVANSAISEARAWWWRNHGTPPKKRVRCWP